MQNKNHSFVYLTEFKLNLLFGKLLITITSSNKFLFLLYQNFF